MAKVLEELSYTTEHGWVRVLDGNRVQIGMTDFIQEQLGDIVFIELPEEGAEISAEQGIGTLESVKTVSDFYAPVSGKVVQVNRAVLEQPDTVNKDPYGEGWLLELRISGNDALSHLLSGKQYEQLIGGGTA